MIIKPEQWIRTDYGIIMSYDTILENYTIGEFLALHQNFTVKDTSRELVDCDDLICTVSTPYPRFVFDKVEGKCVMGFNYDVDVKDITDIYIKCEVGNYILQNINR